MKPVTKRSAIAVRLTKLNAKPPKRPLRGLGNVRVEWHGPRTFTALLARYCPNHCDVVTSREPVNRFGKLGFVGHTYVSPELSAVTDLNINDINALEVALSTVESFKLSP